MDDEPDILDHMMANGFVLEVFMLQIALDQARTKDSPKEWARDFVSALYARIDANEGRMELDGSRVHELARGSFDRLARQLDQLLDIPPSVKP